MHDVGTCKEQRQGARLGGLPCRYPVVSGVSWPSASPASLAPGDTPASVSTLELMPSCGHKPHRSHSQGAALAQEPGASRAKGVSEAHSPGQMGIQSHLIIAHQRRPKSWRDEVVQGDKVALESLQLLSSAALIPAFCGPGAGSVSSLFCSFAGGFAAASLGLPALS